MKHITLILAATLLFSCTDSATVENKNVAIENETPQALTDKDYDIESSWESKRYNNNIIEKLYDEALENDKELAALNKQFNIALGYKNDSLTVYNKYINNNKTYWNLVSNYVHQLEDSILLKVTQKEFDILKSNYENRIEEHEKKIKVITKKSSQLKGQLVLLKLKVTAPMMLNYQENEMPSEEPLNQLIIDYDSLIKESKAFIKKIGI